MSTQVAVLEDFNNITKSVEGMQKLCAMLMNTKHYAKLGQEGVFAVVAKARSLSIDPLDALNGGLYCVQGKVEMSAQMMNQLIRQAGHSITKDPKSDDKICVLHGKRADTQDTWTESFSIDDAKKAGIYKEGGPWTKYTKDMLFARALSRLARQLYPDVIKGCYVEGEISQSLDAERNQAPVIVKPVQYITSEQAEILKAAFEEFPDYRDQVMDFLSKNNGVKEITMIPASLYDRIITGAQKRKQKKLEEQEKTLNEIEVTAEVAVNE